MSIYKATTCYYIKITTQFNFRILKHEDGETNDFDVHSAPCFLREMYEINNQV